MALVAQSGVQRRAQSRTICAQVPRHGSFSPDSRIPAHQAWNPIARRICWALRCPYRFVTRCTGSQGASRGEGAETTDAAQERRTETETPTTGSANIQAALRL